MLTGKDRTQLDLLVIPDGADEPASLATCTWYACLPCGCPDGFVHADDGTRLVEDEADAFTEIYTGPRRRARALAAQVTIRLVTTERWMRNFDPLIHAPCPHALPGNG